MAKGIDVSQWQGRIDWRRVETDFVIIRAGYGRLTSQKDTEFEANYTGARSRGIPCGAYWFSYAVTPDDARAEADACLSVIRGKQFEYPIYYDVEDSRILSLGKSAVSSIIRAFMEKMENAGYFVGLYMSADNLPVYTDENIREKYAVWVADYDTDMPDYDGAYGMWQKSSTGKIDGINGNVDIDEAFENYPEIIRKAGLNGLSPEKKDHLLTIIIDGETIIQDYRF